MVDDLRSVPDQSFRQVLTKVSVDLTLRDTPYRDDLPGVPCVYRETRVEGYRNFWDIGRV